jgi:hypothetical protein
VCPLNAVRRSVTFAQLAACRACLFPRGEPREVRESHGTGADSLVHSAHVWESAVVQSPWHPSFGTSLQVVYRERRRRNTASRVEHHHLAPRAPIPQQTPYHPHFKTRFKPTPGHDINSQNQAESIARKE